MSRRTPPQSRGLTPLAVAVARLRNMRPAWRLGVAAAAVAMLWLAGTWLLQRRLGSDAVFNAFVRAVEMRDVAAVYALTADLERSRLGVNPDVISRCLRNGLYAHAARVRAVRSRLDDGLGRYADRWHLRAVAWVDAASGRPLPSRHPMGQFQSVVYLYRQNGGEWRVCFTRFAYTLIQVNHTLPAIKSLPAGAPEEDRARIRQARNAALASWGLRHVTDTPPLIRKAGLLVVDGEPVVQDL